MVIDVSLLKAGECWVSRDLFSWEMILIHRVKTMHTEFSETAFFLNHKMPLLSPECEYRSVKRVGVKCQGLCSIMKDQSSHWERLALLLKTNTRNAHGRLFCISSRFIEYYSYCVIILWLLRLVWLSFSVISKGGNTFRRVSCSCSCPLSCWLTWHPRDTALPVDDQELSTLSSQYETSRHSHDSSMEKGESAQVRKVASLLFQIQTILILRLILRDMCCFTLTD